VTLSYVALVSMPTPTKPPQRPEDSDARRGLAEIEDAGVTLGEYEAACAACTERELRFAIELAKGARLADAHAAAGYRYRGSMRARAHDAYRIRQRPNVMIVERCLRRVAIHRAEVEVADVRAELVRIAFSNIKHYVIEPGGTVGLAPDAPADAMRAVAWCDARCTKRKGIERISTVLRLWDKLSALRLLAEDLGIVGMREGPNAATSPCIIVEGMPRDGSPASEASVGWED